MSVLHSINEKVVRYRNQLEGHSTHGQRTDTLMDLAIVALMGLLMEEEWERE